MENFKNEIWKTISGFENYQVSNLGRVKATDYINKRGYKEKERILKPSKTSDGYLQVWLTGQNVKKSIKIHRLVGIAFINNLHDKPTINHKDGDKTNNHVDNLEWNTVSEQLKHAYSTGLRTHSEITKKRIKIANGKPVKCFNKLTMETTYHASARDCSKYVGKSKRWCDKIIGTMNGETYNYKLEYLNEIKDRKGTWKNGMFIKESDL